MGRLCWMLSRQRLASIGLRAKPGTHPFSSCPTFVWATMAGEIICSRTVIRLVCQPPFDKQYDAAGATNLDPFGAGRGCERRVRVHRSLARARRDLSRTQGQRSRTLCSRRAREGRDRP
jgi:hypothetical protein